MLKTILMMVMFFIRKSDPKKIIVKTVLSLNSRLSKGYFLRLFSSNFMFFALFSSVGVENDIMKGSAFQIHSAVLNGFLALVTLGLLGLVYAFNLKTWKILNSPPELFSQTSKNPFFLKDIATEYKLNKKSFFFFTYRPLKLVFLGALGYGLYYIPLAQIISVVAVESAYFLGIIMIRPYVNYFKLLTDFLFHLMLIVLIGLSLAMHPILGLVPYTGFSICGLA